MPKKKQKRKPNSAAFISQTEKTGSTAKARAIRWASIAVIIAILLSLMIAAISVSPSQAATSSTPVATCAPIDTDHDGIINNLDSDIDGDGIVNGLDPDIDGDSIANGKDSDPAATNCGFNAPPPIIRTEETNEGSNLLVRIAAVAVLLIIGVGYIVLRRIRRSRP